MYKRPTNTKKEKERAIREICDSCLLHSFIIFLFLDLVDIFSCLIILPIVLGSVFITAMVCYHTYSRTLGVLSRSYYFN